MKCQPIFTILSLLKKRRKLKQNYNKLGKLLKRAVQFASVSSCARTSTLEAFQLQMFFMMRTTDDLGMHVPRDISWTGPFDSYIVYLVSACFQSVQALRGLP